MIKNFAIAGALALGALLTSSCSGDDTPRTLGLRIEVSNIDPDTYCTATLLPVDLSGNIPVPLVVDSESDGSFEASGTVTVDRGSTVQVSCSAMNSNMTNGADVKVIVTRDGSDWKTYSVQKGDANLLMKVVTVK
jgi:hypothetical protein